MKNKTIISLIILTLVLAMVLVGCGGDGGESIPEEYKIQISECRADGSTGNSCIMHLAQDSQRASICKEISEIEMLDNCVLYVAMDVHKTSVCKFASSLESKSNCIKRVAWDLQDIKICKEISDIIIENKCLVSIGERQEDYSVCKIATDVDSCIDTFLNFRQYGTDNGIELKLELAKEYSRSDLCEEIPKYRQERSICDQYLDNLQ